jgi:alpha-L-rhamnosidase
VRPLGIDSRVPRLSWKLESGNLKLETRSVAEIARGVRQRAYQILVASSEELLKQDKGDLWDSGKVASDQSVNVEYAGKPLTSNQRCFWKVRVWTSRLETSATGSGVLSPESKNTSSWSNVALFSMGLLDPSDWQGEWIRFQQADNIKHIWYRKTFALESVPESAFAYLASIGYHELYVNGERIGDRVLSPGVTDLEKRALYVTYDIKSKLKKGDRSRLGAVGWLLQEGCLEAGLDF